MVKKYHVLSDAAPAALGQVKSRHVLLAGEPVFVALRTAEQSPPVGYIPQPPRDGVRGLMATLAKNMPKLSVSVDERLLALKKCRFAFAIDGYLAWGLRREHRRRQLILFGGAGTADSTNVEILVFANEKLAAVHEKTLPPADAPHFQDALGSMVAEMRHKYATARMVQAAPLPDWKHEQIEYIGDLPLRSLSYRPLSRTDRQRSAIVVPGAIVAAGLLTYGGMLLAGWGAYSSAVEGYDHAVADPAVLNKGGIDTAFLDVMSVRRYYMGEPRRQEVLAEKADQVVKGVAAVDRVQILEMKLPAPSVAPQQQVGVSVSPDAEQQRRQISPDRSPDVWISISVPRSAEPAMVQAKEDVLRRIANATGMSVRLPNQGIREDKGRRIFDIEGFFHD